MFHTTLANMGLFQTSLVCVDSLTLVFIQSEGKYDGNTVNRRRSVKKSARQLGNPRDETLEKKSARWVWASVSD